MASRDAIRRRLPQGRSTKRGRFLHRFALGRQTWRICQDQDSRRPSKAGVGEARARLERVRRRAVRQRSREGHGQGRDLVRKRRSDPPRPDEPRAGHPDRREVPQRMAAQGAEEEPDPDQRRWANRPSERGGLNEAGGVLGQKELFLERDAESKARNRVLDQLLGMDWRSDEERDAERFEVDSVASARGGMVESGPEEVAAAPAPPKPKPKAATLEADLPEAIQIGRASCRERV